MTTYIWSTIEALGFFLAYENLSYLSYAVLSLCLTHRIIRRSLSLNQLCIRSSRLSRNFLYRPLPGGSSRRRGSQTYHFRHPHVKSFFSNFPADWPPLTLTPSSNLRHFGGATNLPLSRFACQALFPNVAPFLFSSALLPSLNSPSFRKGHKHTAWRSPKSSVFNTPLVSRCILPVQALASVSMNMCWRSRSDRSSSPCPPLLIDRTLHGREPSGSYCRSAAGRIRGSSRSR